MSHKDAPTAASIKHCRDFSIIDDAHSSPPRSENVNTFIVKHYPRQSLYAVLPEVTNYASPRNW